MKAFEGVEYIKMDNCSMFLIENFTDDIKMAIREQLSEICYGFANASSGRAMFDYKNTVKELMKRLSDKQPIIRIGMIGELLVHLILLNYFDEYKSVKLFFNMEERSITKGYDLILTRVDRPELWIAEVKSGELHYKKDAKETLNDLLSTAKRDLAVRLNASEGGSLWAEAICGARVAFEDNDTMKEAIVEVLGAWGDEAVKGNNTSYDKNIMLAGVLFSELDDCIDIDDIDEKQKLVESSKKFKQTYVLGIQKPTYEKVYDFLQEEATE